MKEADLISDEKFESIDYSPTAIISGTWHSNFSDYFSNLLEMEQKYVINPDLFSHQSEITPLMRSILLDWMMEVCKNWYLKKETFFISLSALDRYLSNERVKKTELQLVGLTCLYISCKREEASWPKIEDFSKAAQDVYTVMKIKNMETQILRSLKWQMNPVTFQNWLNAILQEWDNYLKFILCLNCKDELLNEESFQKSFIVFRIQNKYAYQRYFECFELLNLCILKYEINQFLPVKVVAAIVYLMVSRYFSASNYKLIPRNEEITDESDCKTVVDRLLQVFLLDTLKMETIESIFPALNYVQKFINYKFENQEKNFFASQVFENYEEFLGLQGHNSELLIYVHDEVSLRHS